MISPKECSLEDVYERLGFGKFQIFIVILLGLFHARNSGEMSSMSFMGPILTCFWKISMDQYSFFTIPYFIGMFIGKIIFGIYNDVHGRKSTLMICGCGILYFNIICAYSPTFIWVVITKLVLGIFIGGSLITMVVVITELTPSSHRGRTLMFWNLFEAIGSLYMTLLTFGLVPNVGWRLWLSVAVTPMLVILFGIALSPESPRYLLVANRKMEAIKVLNQIATLNNVEEIENVKMINSRRHSWYDLFHPNYSLTVFIVSYLWFVIGLSHNSMVLLSPIINHIPRKCLQNMSIISEPPILGNSTPDYSCCVPISWNILETIVISNFGDIISFVIAILLIVFIRRKIYIQILLLIIAFVYFLMNLCLSPINMGILLMFGRGASITVLAITNLYTSEVFPTAIRGHGMGFCTSFINIGSMISSLIVYNIMSRMSFMGGTIFYCIVNIVAFILVFFLPYETKDRVLLETLDDDVCVFSNHEKHK